MTTMINYETLTYFTYPKRIFVAGENMGEMLTRLTDTNESRHIIEAMHWYSDRSSLKSLYLANLLAQILVGTLETIALGGYASYRIYSSCITDTDDSTTINLHRLAVMSLSLALSVNFVIFGIYGLLWTAQVGVVPNLARIMARYKKLNRGGGVYYENSNTRLALNILAGVQLAILPSLLRI